MPLSPRRAPPYHSTRTPRGARACPCAPRCTHNDRVRRTQAVMRDPDQAQGPGPKAQGRRQKAKTRGPSLILAGAIAVAVMLGVNADAIDESQRYHESIPGTLVTFEMVPVPAGRVTMSDASGKRD